VLNRPAGLSRRVRFVPSGTERGRGVFGCAAAIEDGPAATARLAQFSRGTSKLFAHADVPRDFGQAATTAAQGLPAGAIVGVHGAGHGQGRLVDGHGTSSRLEHWCSARPRQRDAGHGGAVCSSRKDKPHGQDARCRRGGSRNPHVGGVPLLSDRGSGRIIALNRTSVAAPSSAEAAPCGSGPVQASACLSVFINNDFVISRLGNHFAPVSLFPSPSLVL
jgi:hypothetical protein